MRLLLTFAAISCALAKPIYASNHAPRSISFAAHNEYTLSEDYDLEDSQTLFQINPPHLSGVVNVGDELGAQSPERILDATPTISLQARPTTIWRPKSTEAFQRARLRSLRDRESEAVEWEEAEVYAPDIQDQYTITQLARMTGNAYALPGHSNWYDMDINWNKVSKPGFIYIYNLCRSQY